jgi:trans-aconitate methyltransferase
MTQTTTQTWNAAEYAERGRFVADLASEVFELLTAKPGERILDLACGDGALTQKIVSAGATVVGFDSSPDMIRAARALGLDARLGDAQALPFHAEFDAVFSNAALHWMKDQDAVLAGVRRALKPGGRFVAEMGGHGNIAAISVALHAVLRPLGVDGDAGQNYFPTPAAYRSRLEHAGFEVRQMQLIPRLTPLPASGMLGWLQTFRRGLLEQFPEPQRESILDATVDLLRPALCDEEGNWVGDYVRLRFVAVAV